MNYIELGKMSPTLLMLEFERMVILENENRIDKTVNYSVRDLKEQIMHRLSEYNIDRY